MANYIFENLTQSQAAAFNTGTDANGAATNRDYLIFGNGMTSAASLTVAPAQAPTNSTAPSGTDYGVVLTDGAGHSFTFSSAALSSASLAGHLVFNDQSNLVIGSNTTGDTIGQAQLNSNGNSNFNANNVVYGLGGNDNITVGNGNNYVFGGADTPAANSTAMTVGGGDTITAGDGNNHLYGNARGVMQGAVDGNDSITAGNGSNYINGNAGNDIITVGTNANASANPAVTGSSGYNRVFGGAGNDTINIQGALGSHAAVNGNLGNDTINDSSAGTNELRGGQGDDRIVQSGASHDLLKGDAGNDTIVASGASNHLAVMSGGTGADYFDFSTQGAGAVAHFSSSTGMQAMANGSGTYPAGTVTAYQEITDFTASDGDHIHLANLPTTVSYSQTVFATATDAQNYALSMVTTGNVVALNVGTASSYDAYVFYNDVAAGSTATTAATAATLGVMHLDGVQASAVTTGNTGVFI